MSLTHEFLSEMFGVQRSTATSLARSLQDLGLVRYRRDKIEIVDRRGPEEKTCECYDVVRHKKKDVFSSFGPPSPALRPKEAY